MEDSGIEVEQIVTQLGHIDQHTIECDLRAFTAWLNKLVDQLNYTTRIAVYAKELAEKNEKRICMLEKRVDAIEKELIAIKERITNLEKRMDKAEADIIQLGDIINVVNQRVDNLYRWLPVPYGLIDGYGWKFAMGNINVMSANGGTPALPPGVGIYTSPTLEDNDIYFN